MGLPCQHIFRARKEVGLPLFESSTISERWEIKYYEKLYNLRFNNDDQLENADFSMAKTAEPAKRKPLSQAQKFKQASKVTQILASLASEGGMKTFTLRMRVLNKILELWETGKEVTVLEEKHLVKDESENSMELDLHEQQVESCDDNIEEEITLKDETSQLKRKKNIDDEECILSELRKKGEIKGERHNEEKDEDTHDDFNSIKMPPKMKKRGRPKGAEVTVIGLPRTKKKKTERSKVTPYKCLKPIEKDKVILECLTISKLAASESLAGRRLLDDNDVQTNAQIIPDTVRDKTNIDINRVEKYFKKETWLIVLSVLQRKDEIKWQCELCSKSIRDNQSCISCDRCLQWFHLNCTSLSTKPKARNWFCKMCKSKYI